MKFINIRQLMRDFNGSIKDLPVMVTKFGQPIFEIIPVSVAANDKGEVMDLRGAKIDKKKEKELKDVIITERHTPAGHNCSWTKSIGGQQFYCFNKAVEQKDGKWWCKDHL